MKITLAEAFQRDVRALAGDQRLAVFESILGLPRAMGDVHVHSGLGLRKLHSSGIWEARVGLGLRMVFAQEPDRLTLVRVGTHDEVRRFLRRL